MTQMIYDYLLTPARSPRKVYGHRTYVCPACSNGSHTATSTGAWICSDGKHIYCPSCGYLNDAAGIIMDRDGIGYTAAKQVLAAMQGQPVRQTARPASTQAAPPASEDYRDLYARARSNQDNVQFVNYLTSRRIKKETATRYGVGYLPAWSAKPGAPKTSRVIVPFSRSDYDARATTATYAAKMHVGRKTVFNRAAAGADLYAITEGPFDALSLCQAGIPAMATGGVAIARLIDAVDEMPFPGTALICTDRDDAGMRAAAEIREAFDARGWQTVTPPSDIWCGQKDVNAAHIYDPDRFEALLRGYVTR